MREEVLKLLEKRRDKLGDFGYSLVRAALEEANERELAGFKGLLELLEGEGDLYEKLAEGMAYAQLVAGKSIKLFGSAEEGYLLPSHVRRVPEDLDFIVREGSAKALAAVLLLEAIAGRTADLPDMGEREVFGRRVSAERVSGPFAEAFHAATTPTYERYGKVAEKIRTFAEALKNSPPHVMEDLLENAALSLARRLKEVHGRRKDVLRAVLRALEEEAEEADPGIREIVREVYSRAWKYVE